MNQLQQLKQASTVVADTGDFLQLAVLPRKTRPPILP